MIEKVELRKSRNIETKRTYKEQSRLYQVDATDNSVIIQHYLITDILEWLRFLTPYKQFAGIKSMEMPVKPNGSHQARFEVIATRHIKTYKDDLSDFEYEEYRLMIQVDLRKMPNFDFTWVLRQLMRYLYVNGYAAGAKI